MNYKKYDREHPSPVAVKDIWWEHIYLYMELAGENIEQYTYWVTDLRGNWYPMEREGNTLCFNVVNVPGVKVLPSTKWYLFLRDADTDEAGPIRVLPECGYKLEDLDKVYRYAAEQCAYVVTLEIREGGPMTGIVRKHDREIPGDQWGTQGMYLYLNTDYMRKNKSGARRNPFAETYGFKGAVHGILVRSTKVVMNAVYQLLYKCQKHDGKHILLMSETRIPIGGNLKALDDRIKERGLDREYHMTYSFSRTLQDGALARIKNWTKLLYMIAGQDMIFVDDYVPIFQSIKLRKETKLIQLWHAGVGFKSVGYARFGRRGSPHPTGSCHRRYDYAIVGAKGLIPVYEEVFGIPRDHILPYGIPRMDGYDDPEKAYEFRARFYAQYPELEDKKIIMFAPTFRGTGQKNAMYPWDKVDFEAIYQMCGEEYVFMIKMHPFVTNEPETPLPEEYKSRILDFSQGWDINELFYVTDILITDFSSNIYEFSVQNKPMIFYAFDKDYYQLTRGVHRRLEEFAPGKICETFEEVIRAIREKDFEEYRRERFIRESFDKQETNASDRIIDELILGKK